MAADYGKTKKKPVGKLVKLPCKKEKQKAVAMGNKAYNAPFVKYAVIRAWFIKSAA